MRSRPHSRRSARPWRANSTRDAFRSSSAAGTRWRGARSAGWPTIWQRRRAQRIGVVNFDAHFDLRRDTRGTSGTPFLQIAEDCAARGWPFRYACLGVSRYANTEALFARAHELEVLWQLDESTSVAGTSPALAAFVADVEAVYLTRLP